MCSSSLSLHNLCKPNEELHPFCKTTDFVKHQSCFFRVPTGKFYTWLTFLHNQRLWWLWQISGVSLALLSKYIEDCRYYLKVKEFCRFFWPSSLVQGQLRTFAETLRKFYPPKLLKALHISDSHKIWLRRKVSYKWYTYENLFSIRSKSLANL